MTDRKHTDSILGKVKSITIITWMVAQRLVAEILLMSVMQLKKGRYSVER